ncbi:MAG: NDP-sugar synthase [Acidimicrobiia bacterium]|nr:NDP-sugar synthase [Acidimicrobiia bacterium]
MTIRHAVLLVGGRGTRLWPLTATVPKGLLPLAGVPFVEYQLGRLADAGVEQAWLAIGTEHQSTWERYAAQREGSPAVSVSVEQDRLDTAGPVTQLLDQLDDTFFVLNGDVVFDTALLPFMESAPDAGAVLALARVDDPSAYGVVVTDSEGMVDRFVEKPSREEAPTDTVNAGVYILNRRAFDGFEVGALSFEQRVFPELVARHELAGVVVEGSWLDIGTPDLWLESHAAVLGGRTGFGGADGHITAESALVGGEVLGSWSWVGAGATVEKGATIEEAIILDGAIVREGARVSQAVVGWGSEVGVGAEVSGMALVGEGCVIGAGCELAGGSRVAPGTHLAPGSITVAPPS